MLLNNYWVKEKNGRRDKRYIETNKSNTTTFQNEHATKAPLRAKIMGLSQETRKIPTSLTFHLKKREEGK